MEGGHTHHRNGNDEKGRQGNCHIGKIDWSIETASAIMPFPNGERPGWSGIANIRDFVSIEDIPRRPGIVSKGISLDAITGLGKIHRMERGEKTPIREIKFAPGSDFVFSTMRRNIYIRMEVCLYSALSLLGS